MEKNPTIPNLNLLIYCLFAILFLCPGCENEVITVKPEMWGDLERGDYFAGFKTIFTFDHSRSAVPYSDWNGRLAELENAPGRQMQINVWYPAKHGKNSDNLDFGHYLKLMAQQTGFTEPSAEKLVFFEKEFITKANALGGSGAVSEANIDSLKGLKTFAFENAAPANGKFPLVVFPNGGSPVFQSIQCEYLASHGFVVAAFAVKGFDSFTEEVSFRGLEIAVSDIGFVLRQLVDDPMVDKTRIGMIGNAITSSQIAAFASRSEQIKCMVSLEGGLLSVFEQRLLDNTAFYSPGSFTLPVLAIYAPHPSIDPSHIYNLKYSNRYFVHFPQMTEFHFLNFGPLDRFFPGIIGNHDGDVQKGYEWGMIIIKMFLEAQLNNKTESLDFFTKRIPEGADGHIDTIFTRKALNPIPSITHLKNAFITEGFGAIEAVYTTAKAENPAPFPKSFYSDFRDWLAWKKDPDHEFRMKLYQLAIDSYPDSPEMHYYLSYYKQQTGDQKGFEFHKKETLRLLDLKNDPDLKVAREVRMRENLAIDFQF